MQVIRAADPRDYNVAVWLNGRDVTHQATACRVPRSPGRIGWGWVDVIAGQRAPWLRESEEPTVFVPEPDAEGNLIFYRKHGFVRWERSDKGKRGSK